jgi:anti-anti-sigma factor
LAFRSFYKCLLSRIFFGNPSLFIILAGNKRVSGTIPEKRQTMALCGVRTNGGIIIVVMPLQIDHVVAMTLELELRELAASEPKALLCDFSSTKYISSSGLRIIIMTAKTLKAAGSHFGVFSLTPFVDHIFTTSGFSQILSIYDTEEAALRAISR